MESDRLGLVRHSFQSRDVSPGRISHTAPFRRAYGKLFAAVRYEGGLLLLTGQRGVGKTTLLRKLAQEQTKIGGFVALVSAVETASDSTATMVAVCKALGATSAPAGSPERRPVLAAAIEAHRRHSGHVLVVVDDAERLSDRDLADLVSLATVEAGRHAQRALLLAGGSELSSRLAAAGLLAGDRYVSVRLPPLDEADVRRYLRDRLDAAGQADLDLFDAEAVTQIAQRTSGVPVVIDRLCVAVLDLAARRKAQRITSGLVEEAAVGSRAHTRTGGAIDPGDGPRAAGSAATQFVRDVAHPPPAAVAPLVHLALSPAGDRSVREPARARSGFGGGGRVAVLAVLLTGLAAGGAWLVASAGSDGDDRDRPDGSAEWTSAVPVEPWRLGSGSSDPEPDTAAVESRAADDVPSFDGGDADATSAPAAADLDDGILVAAGPTSAATPATDVPVSPPPSLQPNDGTVAGDAAAPSDSLLITRGDEFFANSDVVSARLFYRRAADNGSGPAAAAMAATFDPAELSRRGVRGVSPDAVAALKWYRIATELGDPTARAREDALLDRLRGEAARGDDRARAALDATGTR